MIGAFVINDEDDVCFVQYGAHERVLGLCLAASNSCLVVHEDGSEEMFTTEFNSRFIESLRKMTQILIVHMSDGGQPLDEYEVPLTVRH